MKVGLISFLFVLSMVFWFAREPVFNDTVVGVGNYYIASFSDLKISLKKSFNQTLGFYGPLFRRSIGLYIEIGDLVIDKTELVRQSAEDTGNLVLQGYENIGKGVANLIFATK